MKTQNQMISHFVKKSAALSLTLALAFALQASFQCSGPQAGPGEVELNGEAVSWESFLMQAELPWSDYMASPTPVSSLEVQMKTPVRAGQDYSGIILDVQEIAIRSEAGGWSALELSPVKLDLIGMASNEQIFYGGAYNLEPGVYTQIRLKLGPDNIVTVNGADYPLTIPSGAIDQSGLKLNGTMTLKPYELTAIVLNFDPQSSIVKTGGQNAKYILKPVIQFEQNENVGKNLALNANEYDMLTNITYEKMVVCRGEDVKIDASFVYPYGAPNNITIAIGEEKSPSKVFTFSSSGIHSINVVATDSVGLYENVRVPILVDDCEIARVDLQEGESVSGKGKSFVAAAPGMSGDLEYTWDFGDGTVVTTKDASVYHMYKNRLQNSRYTSYNVQVSVTDGSEVRTGRLTTTMANFHYAVAMSKGKYMLGARGDSKMNLNGAVYTANYEIENPGAMNAIINTGNMKLTYCDHTKPDAVLSFDPAQAMSSATTVARFGSVTGQLSLPAAQLAGVCSASIRLDGVTEDTGAGVWSSLFFRINIDQAALLPAPPELKQEIDKAVRLLNYPRTVTMEDIYRLRLEGKL